VGVAVLDRDADLRPNSCFMTSRSVTSLSFVSFAYARVDATFEIAESLCLIVVRSRSNSNAYC